MPLIPTLRKLEQISEFKGNLVGVQNHFRIARTIQRS